MSFFLRGFSYCILFIVFLGLLVWGASPFVINHFLKQPLAEHDLLIDSNSRIRINPFTVNLSINKLLITKHSEAVLSINHLSTSISIIDLFSNHLNIKYFFITDFNSTISLKENRLVIAGIVIPGNDSTTSEVKTTESTAFSMSLHQLSINNSTLKISTNHQQHALEINELLMPLSKFANKTFTGSIKFEGVIDGSNTRLSSDFSTTKSNSSLTADISISDYPLEKIEPYIKEGYSPLEKISGNFSSQFDLSLQKMNNDIVISSNDFSVSQSNLSLLLKNIIQLDMPEFKQQTIQLTIEANPSNNPQFSFAKINISANKTNRLVDLSHPDTEPREFTLEHLTLSALDSKKPNTITKLDFLFNSNEYEKGHFTGDIKPLATPIDITLNGKISEFSLLALSPYIKDSTSLAFDSGQLDSDFSFSLRGDQLAGHVDLLLKHIKTHKSENEDISSLKNNTVMPLNMALDLLKDRDSNIKLEIPISGSTDDPNFGFGSFISLITKKAVYSATQSYLINTFVPYANVVSVALSGSDFLLKVRFEDLVYQAGQTSIEETQKPYIQQFIQLMNDKADLVVNVCAASTASDLNLVTKEKITDKPTLLQLKNLAKERAVNFKRYVLEHSNIASSRLILCAPKIDQSKHAKSRLMISS